MNWVNINLGKDKDYAHTIKGTHFVNSTFKVTHFFVK